MSAKSGAFFTEAPASPGTTLARRQRSCRPQAVETGTHTTDPPAPTGTPQTMRILIAEDDVVTARLLRALLDSWGFEVITVTDGVSALAVLQTPDAPRLAILDWMMPGLDGPEVCRRARAYRPGVPMYLILVTSREARARRRRRTRRRRRRLCRQAARSRGTPVAAEGRHPRPRHGAPLRTRRHGRCPHRTTQSTEPRRHVLSSAHAKPARAAAGLAVDGRRRSFQTAQRHAWTSGGRRCAASGSHESCVDRFGRRICWPATAARNSR